MNEHEEQQFRIENWERVRKCIASVVAGPSKQMERRLILAELQGLGPSADWTAKEQLELASTMWDQVKTPDGRCFLLWLAFYAVTHIDPPPTEAEYQVIDATIRKRAAEAN